MRKGGQTIGGSYPVDVSKKWNGGKGMAVVERESLEVAGETDGAKKKRRISSKEQVFCDKALAAISKGANVNAYNAGVCICACACVRVRVALPKAATEANIERRRKTSSKNVPPLMLDLSKQVSKGATCEY